MSEPPTLHDAVREFERQFLGRFMDPVTKRRDLPTSTDELKQPETTPTVGQSGKQEKV